jgi:hypothetical protein
MNQEFFCNHKKLFYDWKNSKNGKKYLYSWRKQCELNLKIEKFTA